MAKKSEPEIKHGPANPKKLNFMKACAPTAAPEINEVIIPTLVAFARNSSDDLSFGNLQQRRTIPKPKSVSIPLKCVVRITVFETDVIVPFCKPQTNAIVVRRAKSPTLKDGPPNFPKNPFIPRIVIKPKSADIKPKVT